MFLGYFFAAIDENPFEKIGQFLDDGEYVLPTGSHKVDVQGRTIWYGPVVHFTLESKPDAVTVTFQGSLPKASFGVGCRAAVSLLEFTADGKTWATATWGPKTERRELVWKEAA